MFDVIELGGIRTTKSKSATNHVYLVDVSGSMFGALPKMRQHLKNIVSLITQPDDTFSIIYFSGRGQCGVVCEGIPTKDLSSVTAVHSAIDRWLTPIGLTGFAEPMELSIELAKRLPSDKYNNFIMLTDGYDNQSDRKKLPEQAKALTSVFQSCAFIEYGWYCDRDLLAKLAESSGGTHIFAEGFEEYETAIDNSITEAIREDRVEVQVNKKAKHAIYLHGGNIFIVDVDDGKVSVPESVERVHSIVPKDVLQKQLSEDHLYLILHYAAKTNNSQLVWRCLEALGDVFLIDQYTNAFTKNELSAFGEVVEQAVTDKSMRYLKAKDLSYVPKENAPTVLDVLNVLESSAGSVKVVTDSHFFRYSRTSRAINQTEEDLKFEKTPGQLTKIEGLTWHSSRPNVSIKTRINGVVHLPENEFGLKQVKSFQWKNYTIVRDGILNMKSLPLVAHKNLIDELSDLGPEVANSISIVDDSEDHNVYFVLNFESLPVINRAATKKLDFSEFAFNVAQMNTLQGYKKGLESCLSAKDGKNAGLAEEYGAEAAKWLSSIGVRDYGFSPKGTSAESTDTYTSLEVEYKLKGLSSLPSVKEVQKKLDADKALTLREDLVHRGMSAVKKGDSDQTIKDALKVVIDSIRSIQYNISRDVYTIVLGKTWFDGYEHGEASGEVKLLDKNVPITVEMVQKEVKI